MKFLLVVAVFYCAVGVSLQHESNTFKRLYTNPSRASRYTSARIINGHEVVPHEIPYQVFITFTSESGGWLCGGSLISENYVLTAGHCTYSAISATVSLGRHNITAKSESTEQIIESSQLITHEDYESLSISNDIGLIKLESPATLNEAVGVVTLPSRSQAKDDYLGQSVTISGWGLTDGTGTKVSDVLMGVSVKVISNDECYSYITIVQDNQICTSGEENSGSCNGDSGGPLTANGTQIGIVSYGVKYCLPGFPSVFTRTGDYLDWIEANTDVKIN